MRPDTAWFAGFRKYTANRILPAALLLLLAFGFDVVRPVFGDGCFVFRWDKKTDINEPTQKAIIVYDAGREDLLLQVKYEGPLEEFGWLVPVPNVPTIQKGSMQPFYELSQLTQRRFGNYPLNASYGSSRGAVEPVKVVQIKTVGAFEVAVLSAQDAGSLEHWLKAHGYSIPGGKTAIIDDYVRRGWYFVAARIQLDGNTDFRLVSPSSSKEASPTASYAITQRQLSSGELHPLLISFDTPRCIFPLKISSVSGKSSEVSLYVLSSEPLLDKFIYDKAVQKVRAQKREQASNKLKNLEMAKRSLRNAESLQMAWRMYSLTPKEKGKPAGRDWSVNDLESLADESTRDITAEPIDYDSYSPPQELLQCLSVPAGQLTQCITNLPRLRNRNWYLTKQVHTFQPEEMHDLDFQNAVPVLASCLPNPEGQAAAQVLAQCPEQAVPVLRDACKSTNSIERLNAATALSSLKDTRLLETVLALMQDELPGIRYRAVMATSPIWSDKFVDPLISLFKDPHPAVRIQAWSSLAQHEPASHVAKYVVMLNDRDPNVRNCAFRLAVRIDPESIPRSMLLTMLRSSELAVITETLSLFQDAPGTELPNVMPIRSNFPSNSVHHEAPLSSDEAAPLVTNRLTLTRLMGVKILRKNADAAAVSLAMPLLQDTNTLVRTRALSLLQAVTGQSFPIDDIKAWHHWWEENRAGFSPPPH